MTVARQALQRLPIYAACTALAILSNYLLGKDLMWDTLNYHFYAGFSALHDRFGQDYFAAGPWSYFNPYAYVPFYALAGSGLSALAASSLLAVAGSALLWLTYELALLAYPLHLPRTRIAVGVCAVCLAFLNPVLIQGIGSSYADITTAIPVLAGWLLLAQTLRHESIVRVVWAGLLLGAATALKLTNAVHAVSAVALLCLLPQPLSARIRAGLTYACALAVAFVLVSAPWSYRLERTFGNPMFPLLNGVFHSPEITSAPLLLYRFVPAGLLESLWRPFAMINPVPLVHVEGSAPDVRYAVLAALVSVLVVRSLWRRLRPPGLDPTPAEPDPLARSVSALGAVLVLDWVLWLRTSGNSRYFLPAASVAAILIVVLLFRLLAHRHKLRNYILAAIVGVQLVEVVLGTDFRWIPVPWGGAWFQVRVPQKLAAEPALYLTMGMQTDSFVAPFLARGSGLVNFSGALPVDTEGVGWARVERLIHRYQPHVRILLRGERLYEDSARRQPRIADVDEALQRFALRVDPSDCATLSVYGLPPDLQITVAGPSKPVAPQDTSTTYMVSCRLIPDPTDHSADLLRQRAADRVFEEIETACPALFQPRGLSTEHHRGEFLRRYVNTDLTAWISYGEVKFRDVPRGDDAVDIGRESDWQKGDVRLACGRRDGHYFARVLPSNAVP